MFRFKKNKLNLTYLMVAVMAVWIFGGCAKVSRFLASSEPFRTETYKTMFHTWSREGRIHRGLEVILIASTTLKSEGFRLAYTEEFAAAYRLTDEEKKKLRQDQSRGVGEHLEFIMATYVPEKKWDEFDKVQSMWKLYLVNEKNEQVTPVQIKKLKSGDPVSAHFYPYITPWKSIYTVRFPVFSKTEQPCEAQHNATYFKLVITSVLGTTEMVWDMRS
jgi:hypothetical protein